MLIGAVSVFLVAHQAVSYGIAVATLVFLLAGYGVGRLPTARSAAVYAETMFLTITTFLLMVPTVSETLRRVPDGHPFVTDLKSPLLLGAQGALFAMLIVGLIVQIVYLRRQGKTARIRA